MSTLNREVATFNGLNVRRIVGNTSMDILKIEKKIIKLAQNNSPEGVEFKVRVINDSKYILTNIDKVDEEVLDDIKLLLFVLDNGRCFKTVVGNGGRVSFENRYEQLPIFSENTIDKLNSIFPITFIDAEEYTIVVKKFRKPAIKGRSQMLGYTVRYPGFIAFQHYAYYEKIDGEWIKRDRYNLLDKFIEKPTD